MSLYATDLIDIGKPIKIGRKKQKVEQPTPPESVEEEVIKKPRSEKQIAAAEKMRAARVAKYHTCKLTLLEKRQQFSQSKKKKQLPLKRLNWLIKKPRPSPLRKPLQLKNAD